MPATVTKSLYEQRIREDAAALGFLGTNPRHIEAFMRLEHPTLDGLSARQFRDEVRLAIDCIRHGGTETAEDCARSFGLVAPRGD